jgi:mannose-6-phosphate isomerase-like protein (cupin superfamily)
LPLITAAQAPVFTNSHATFTGLASPSRGSTENSCWRLVLKPGTDAPPHALTREEIFVPLSGRLRVTIDSEVYELGVGECLVVPAHQMFALANPWEAPFEALVVLPVGGQGLIPGKEPVIAPWAL